MATRLTLPLMTQTIHSALRHMFHAPVRKMLRFACMHDAPGSPLFPPPWLLQYAAIDSEKPKTVGAFKLLRQAGSQLNGVRGIPIGWGARDLNWTGCAGFQVDGMRGIHAGWDAWDPCRMGCMGSMRDGMRESAIPLVHIPRPTRLYPNPARSDPRPRSFGSPLLSLAPILVTIPCS